MGTYVAKRLLLIVPTLIGAAALVFVIMRVIPGDVALLIFGGEAGGQIDAKQLADMRQRLGLDQPLLVQFGTWLWGILRFDFGNSLWTGRPVIEELLIRLPLSLELAIAATIVSVLIAIPLGCSPRSARTPGSTTSSAWSASAGSRSPRSGSASSAS